MTKISASARRAYRCVVRDTFVWAVVTSLIAIVLFAPLTLVGVSALLTPPTTRPGATEVAGAALLSVVGGPLVYGVLRSVVVCTATVCRSPGYPERHWWFVRRAFRSTLRFDFMFLTAGVGLTAFTVLGHGDFAKAAAIVAAMIDVVARNEAKSVHDHTAHGNAQDEPKSAYDASKDVGARDQPGSARDGSEETDAGRGESDEDPDESWLRSLPVRASLADPTRFDAEALLGRRLQPAVARLAALFQPTLDQMADRPPQSWPGEGYVSVVARLLGVLPPERWNACGRCHGTSVTHRDKLPCKACRGGGFVITFVGRAGYEESGHHVVD